MSVELRYLFFGVLLQILFYNPCQAIKCFDCVSTNNSACLDLTLGHMRGVVPIVDCSRAIPNAISKHFFCRKITQTILHTDRTPELRIMRGCGWVKHKRECYKNDNKDHLETVCQCFGDMCNAASTLDAVKINVLISTASLFIAFRTWRE